MRSAGALVFLVFGGAACSSSQSAPPGLPTGTATLDTSIPTVASHYTASAGTMGADPAHPTIVITSLRGSDACSTVQTTAGAAVFQVVVTLTPSEPEGNIPAGVYSLGDGWQAEYRLADASCATAQDGAATKGTLEIDSIDTSIRGAADMTFPSGTVMTTFDAPVCDSSAARGPEPEPACTSFPQCAATGPSAPASPGPAETCNQNL